MNNRLKKICILTILISLAIILSYVDSLFNIITIIPGFKIGFPNIVIIIVLYLYGFKESLVVNIIRIIIIGFLFGNLFSIIYSVSGGIISLIIMQLIKNSSRFSIYSVSIVGAISHNISQLIVCIIILKSKAVLMLLPYLFLISIISGFVIGVVSYIIINRLKGKLFYD